MEEQSKSKIIFAYSTQCRTYSFFGDVFAWNADQFFETIMENEVHQSPCEPFRIEMDISNCHNPGAEDERVIAKAMKTLYLVVAHKEIPVVNRVTIQTSGVPLASVEKHFENVVKLSKIELFVLKERK